MPQVRNTYADEFVRVLAGGVRVLLYEGQWDWEDGVAPNEDWLDSLIWPGAVQMRATRRRRWTSDGVLLGWAATVGNLTHAVVRNAGHLVAIDQPCALILPVLSLSRVSTHTHMHARTHAHAHTHTHIRMRICTHAHTRRHIHIP